jgi:hypothetical protein
LSRGGKAFITTPPNSKKYQNEERSIEGLVRKFSKNARSIGARHGHVRVRFDPQDSNKWDVSLFGEAQLLEEIYNSSN